MALNIPNSIDTGTSITAIEHQQNYDTIESHVNTEVIHRDGSVAFTQPQAGVDPTGDTHLATKSYVDTATSNTDAEHVGVLKMTAAATAPSAKWLLCRGQAVSRTTYAALFEAIGTAFGAGDGSTTFNVPDFRAKSPAGYATEGFTSNAEMNTLGNSGGSAAPQLRSHIHGMPTHSHTFTTDAGGAHTHTVATKENMNAGGSTGAAMESNSTGTDSTITTSTSGSHTHTGETSAVDPGDTLSQSVGDQKFGNYHPFLVVNFIIKALP